MPWIIIVIGYLLGSIPTAYIAGHILKNGDIRRLGDGNMGAANAFRQLNHRVGVIVGIIDAIKGALAVLLAQAADLSQMAVMLTGAAAVIGHNWPVFIGFRGGRGVSTTIGVLAVPVTQSMLILALPTMLILVLKRNVTPACAFLFILLPLVGWWLKVPAPLIIYGVALPALVGLTTYLRIRPKAVQQA